MAFDALVSQPAILSAEQHTHYGSEEAVLLDWHSGSYFEVMNYIEGCSRSYLSQADFSTNVEVTILYWAKPGTEQQIIKLIT